MLTAAISWTTVLDAKAPAQGVAGLANKSHSPVFLRWQTLSAAVHGGGTLPATTNLRAILRSSMICLLSLSCLLMKMMHLTLLFWRFLASYRQILIEAISCWQLESALLITQMSRQIQPRLR